MDELELKIKTKRRDLKSLSNYINELRISPKLTFLFVELTDKCNLACIHCGSSCLYNNNTFINTEDLFKTLKDISLDFEPKNMMICLTGGEPLLHPDFFNIVNYITKLGFSYGITTNATLIDLEVAKKLKETSIKSVTLSLDGLKDLHEWLRGNKGCFDKVINAINYLKEVGLKVQITSVIHKLNLCQLDELFNFINNLDIYSWRIINIEPIGRANLNKDLLLNKDEFIKLLKFIREKRYDKNVKMDVSYGCAHYLSMEFEREVRDNYFICGAGIYVASILCNGDIYSCLDIKRNNNLIEGNIKYDKIKDVWFNGFKKYRENRIILNDKCMKCSENEFCRADSLHTWDMDLDKPNFCILRGDLYGEN